MNQEEMSKQNSLPKILFVANKWCAGIFDWGISEWENNLLLSPREVGLAETDAFYFDDYYRLTKKKGDESLLQKIKDWKPDIVFLIVSKIPGSAIDVLEWSTLKTIRDDLKIPMTAIWGDCNHPDQIKILKMLLPYTKLNLITDSGAAVTRIKNAVDDPEKCVHVWVPKNPKIWNDPGKIRDIGISYFGSPRKVRQKRIDALLKANIPIKQGGGEASEHLSTEQYADKFQRSKITLSFSHGPYCHVLNARPFEAMACGAMILEEEGCETPVRFIPYIDYVPYSSNKDLVEKAKYYLAHDDEREKIARNGWEKTTTLYSAKRFWKFAIGKTLNPKFGDLEGGTGTLNPANLSHMPKWNAVKLHFFYAFFSNDLAYRINYFAFSSVPRMSTRIRKGLERRLRRVFPPCRQIPDKK